MTGPSRRDSGETRRRFFGCIYAPFSSFSVCYQPLKTSLHRRLSCTDILTQIHHGEHEGHGVLSTLVAELVPRTMGIYRCVTKSILNLTLGFLLFSFS